jgi:rubrerythrin
MEFKQSKTYQNLRNAYERELMISTLYGIFHDKAVDDGYIEISNIFTSTAINEKEHARVFLRKLNDNMIPNTQQNLQSSADYENETGILYRDYANTAKQEGYTDLAALFNGIANIELIHNLNFTSQYNDVLKGEVFCKPESKLWICLQCGNVLGGTCAPAVCPICGFPQGFYELYSDNISGLNR